MQSANKVKLTTQKRQAFVSLLIWEAFLIPPVLTPVLASLCMKVQ